MKEIKHDKKRLNEVKTILVTQPKPKEDNTPFHRLAEKYNLRIIEDGTHAFGRKRKIFIGTRTIAELISSMKEIMKKFPDEKYLFPCSNITRDTISQFLKDKNCVYSEAIIYNTVPRNLKKLKKVFYDILVFYTPSGIDSLVKNFPDFQQNNTRIAGFGRNTAKAIKENKFVVHLFGKINK